MDKRITAQGIIRSQNIRDTKNTNHLKNTPKNEDNKNFEIDRNDFPALNEISGRIGNHGKNSLECSKSFSYSEKLKKAPTDPGPSPKREVSSDSVLGREYSLKNRMPFKSNIMRSLKTNCDNTDSEGSIDVSQSSGRYSNKECFGISKIKSPDKRHWMSDSERNVPRTTNQKNVRTANDGPATKARNEISFENCQTVNSPINRNTKSAMPGRTLNSQSILNKTENFKIGDSFQNAGPSTSSRKMNINEPSFQNRNEGNSSQHYSNNKGINPVPTDLHSIEVKKKKKRKSKVKRQAALQTGKILVLTPEAHSKIFNQSNVASPKQNKDVIANINDCEEYPELGTSVVPKYSKENPMKQVEVASKSSSAVSNNTEADTLKSESNLVTSQLISTNEKTDVAVLKENRDTIGKSPDSEKAPVPVKDPITVSLFDMLLTAKSRKKEAEKKNELVVQDSPLNTAKPSLKVLGKKGVSYTVNPLDSSRPAVKRGKEREKPKVKKPSRMRKLILLGRQLRKEEMSALDESEKTDIACTGKMDTDLSPLKLLESMKDSFNENFVCEKNVLVSDKDCLYDKESSSDENSSSNPSSNEESSIELSSSTNYNSFSNESSMKTFSASKSYEPKASDIFSTENSEDFGELKESDGSLEEQLLNKIFHKSCSTNELLLNHLKECEEQATLRALKSPDHLGDEEKCVSDNTSLYTKTENFDLEMRKNVNSAFNEKKHSVNFIPSPEDCEENNNNISTYQSFSGCNIINDGVSNISEESPSVNILNSVEGKNTSRLGAGHSFQAKSATSFSSVNDEDLSSFSLDSKNSEESPDNDLNSFDQKNLSENVACSDNLQEQTGNNISTVAISDQERSEAVKTMIHSRKFRKYCNHFISKEIDKVVFALLDDLARFQDRLHQKDPVKARVRKRLLYGIKEIKRHMKLKKLKGIILATDIEDIKTEGGLNDIIDQIISLAEAYHVPYIFSHRRFNLGKVCRKGVAVSCVGIFNYEGSEKNFKRILELQEESKHDYLKVVKALDSVLPSNQISEVLKLGKGIPEKLYEVRSNILRDHFKPDSDSSEGELNVPEISTNNDNAVDSKESVCESSNLLMKTNISEPNGINKNEIFNILLKYNIV